MLLTHFGYLHRYELQHFIPEQCFINVIMFTLTNEASSMQKFASLKWDAVGFNELRSNFACLCLYIKTYLLNINLNSNQCVKRGFGVYLKYVRTTYDDVAGHAANDAAHSNDGTASAYDDDAASNDDGHAPATTSTNYYYQRWLKYTSTRCFPKITYRGIVPTLQKEDHDRNENLMQF